MAQGRRLVVTIVFLVISFRELESLYCYECLSVDCPGDSEQCNSVEAFLIEELRQFYSAGKTVDNCPDPTDSGKWRKQQLNTNKCKLTGDDATCSLGRIRVTTRRNDNSKKIVSHATMLGCATRNLIKKSDEKGRRTCNIETSTGAQSRYIHSLEFEHCTLASDWCNFDFCVNPTYSVVRPFQPPGGDRSFEKGTVVGILICVFVIFGVLIAANFCRIPFGRLTNYFPVQARTENGNYMNGVAVSPG